MATISGVTKIIDNIDLSDKNWIELTLSSDIHTAYFIAIKEAASAGDTIDVSEVTSILCEIAIESGITNKEIVIKRVILNFNEITSSDDEINKATAYAQLLNLPTTFKIRPVLINTKDKTYTEGKTSIDVNINPLNLGY